MIDLRNDSAEVVDEADLRNLAEYVMGSLGMAADAELSVLLVDEDEMARLHLEWLDESGPTDVLSFPMDELREPLPGQPAPTGVLGDVVLCPKVAARQAEESGNDTRGELRLLLTHAVLHLLGHDHEEPEGRESMFARQTELLAAFESTRPSPDRGSA